MITKEELLEQEKQLELEHFSNEDAINVGLNILEIAGRNNLNVAVDVSRAGTTLFHSCMNGTGRNNESWLRRKKNTVYQFEKSSQHLGIDPEEGKALLDDNGFSLTDYTTSGGGFPINIKGTGFVGAVIASGLTGEQDHELAARGVAMLIRQELIHAKEDWR